MGEEKSKTKSRTYSGRKKIDRLEKKAKRYGKKVENAKQKIPKKTQYTFQRVFNEKTGKGKYVVVAIETNKPLRKVGITKYAAYRLQQESKNKIHEKITEVEKDNAAVEGAHKTEEKVESVYYFVKRHSKSKQERRLEKVAKLEKKQAKADINVRYHEFLEEHPEVKKKQVQKILQKRKIKKDYAKAKRMDKTIKAAATAVEKTATLTKAIAKKLQEIVARNVSLVVTTGVVGIFVIVIMASVSSCGAMLVNSVSTTMAGSYISDPKEIDLAEQTLTELELNLQEEIDRVEQTYQGYDEYAYNLGEIGHDPFVLASYLSAKYLEFKAENATKEIESLFQEMYRLAITPTIEIRTRRVLNEKTGKEEEEKYEVSVLRVELIVTDLEIIVANRMNEEARELYGIYGETKGLLQMFASPLDLDWYRYISSYYGYRKNPTTGNREFHRGVDIAVPTGTTVYATHDGMITVAAFDSDYGNYIELTNSKGYITKYAHLESLSVSMGQSITTGMVLGTTGNTGSSTGSHLHIECLYNGEYYNPLFYFNVGVGTLYGQLPGDESGVPPDAYDDATVQRLFEEAARYIGMPYTFGGTPPRAFDCSGYVYWVYKNSGVYDLPRTTAQGIYNQTTSISASEAKAGDLIFFKGTYNTGDSRVVTHVGIYCGNGVMLHCGNPIGYTSINSPYWQNHFYGYGRLI